MLRHIKHDKVMNIMASKIKLNIPVPKERNPHVAPSLFRKAGVHDKDESAKRQKAKRELDKQLKDTKLK